VNKVSSILADLCSLRSDYMFCCAAVCVSMCVGKDNHVTELLNLHTLVVQHRLPFYVWCMEVRK